MFSTSGNSDLVGGCSATKLNTYVRHYIFFLSVFVFADTNKEGTFGKGKNISIFICGINMFCVVSTHCTIHKGQSYFLQQTER